ASRRRLFAFLSLRCSSSKFILLTCIHSSKRFFQWRHLLFTRKWMLMNLFLDIFQEHVVLWVHFFVWRIKKRRKLKPQRIRRRK
ncbi:hypothetical protein LINGRAHAP2_LOCUS36725, partial [Linum grandiflorum]